MRAQIASYVVNEPPAAQHQLSGRCFELLQALESPADSRLVGLASSAVKKSYEMRYKEVASAAQLP